jgi:hypothetical protein
MRYSIVILLGILLLAHTARPQSPEENTALPGHFHSESETLGKCSDVAVIMLMTKGSAYETDPPGQLGYRNAIVRIERNIKGLAKGEVTCLYNRRTFPKSVAEEEPVMGTRYIVFMKHSGQLDGRDVYFILRFSAFSDKRVGEIEKMVPPSEAKS